MNYFFFFTDPATTEIYPLSLHDALPIFSAVTRTVVVVGAGMGGLTAALRLARAGFRVRVLEARAEPGGLASGFVRSEEHTSELQSHSDLVCRLLLEKKKRKITLRHSSFS